MVKLGLSGEMIRMTEQGRTFQRENKICNSTEKKKGEHLGTIVKHSRGRESCVGKHVAEGEMKALSWIQITEGLICHVKEFCLVPPGIDVRLKDFKLRSSST